MRYMKMLGLAAVAAAALMAFGGAGTASADGVLCSTTVSPCPAAQKWAVPQAMDLSLKGSSALTNAAEPLEELDTCTVSTIQGNTTNNPDANGEATGLNTKITWEKCTFATTQIAEFLGGFRVDQIAGTSNGTVRADGEIRVTIHTIFFGSCVYRATGGAVIGTLKEGKGTEAEFKAEKAAVEKGPGSSFACPEKALWTANYVLTTPSTTTLSVSSS